jgi:hypothetical protein
MGVMPEKLDTIEQSICRQRTDEEDLGIGASMVARALLDGVPQDMRLDLGHKPGAIAQPG